MSFFISNNPLQKSVSYIISEKKVKLDIFKILGGSTLVIMKISRHYNFYLLLRILVIDKQEKKYEGKNKREWILK